MSFNGATVLCGVNGTKETTRKLHIGGGIVEEVVTTPCNDCGDLSDALEWSAWAPCADETIDEWTGEETSEEISEKNSGRDNEGLLCRRRGNTYMGFEEEGRCQTYLRKKQILIFILQRSFVRLLGHSSQQVATGDQWVQKLFEFVSFENSLHYITQGSTSPQ